MIAPPQRNNKALNKACVIRWKKARVGSPRPRLAIITPSCLSVERAIIFFKSHSTMADMPAINIVAEEITKMEGLNHQIDVKKG